MPDLKRIRELNDAFRTTLKGGSIMVTQGVSRLYVWEVLKAVRAFDKFENSDDPYGEHDFGAFQFGEQTLYWKIDAYGKDLASASPDPCDPAITTRVLTVMLAEEY